jgi:hypothetical protein
MTSYLVYWKPLNVDWDNPGSLKMRHAASNQYYKVHPGDRLYFITYHQGVFYLVGRILVDRIVGQLEAAKFLRCAPEELWTSDYHALAAKARAMPRVAIPCEDALGKLLIKCGTQIQPIKKPFVPARFQSIRHLTPGSAHILDDLLSK